MNKNQLEQFICVAKENSLTKAAEKLFISQQALSKNISALEKSMGVKLFVRSEKGMELTKIGEQIFPVAQSLLTKIRSHEEIINGIIKRNKDTLSLLFEHSFMAFVIQPSFYSKIGDFRTISQTAGSYSKCERDLLNEKFDLALVQKPEVVCDGLEYIPITSGRPVILMNKNHYLARNEYIRISDPKDVAQILPEAGYNAMKQYIESCIEEGFYPNVVMTSGDLELIQRSISENVGVCVSTEYGLQGDAQGDVVSRPLIHSGYLHQVGFLVKKGRENEPRIHSFVNAICSYYLE